MYLKDLIERLSKEKKKKVIKVGFCNPHSYRGYYEQLAFEVKENVTVGSMLKCAKQALGSTYNGYKSGKYKMHEYTEVWLADNGHEGESLGSMLLEYMLKDE